MKVTKKQYDKWTTPSKASYIGLWVGAIGTIFGIVSLGVAVYFYYNPPKSPPSASDEYIRTTTPTIVELSDTSFLSWLGDDEKSLTLSYENTSKVSARNFSAYLKVKGEQIESFKSVAFKDVNMDVLSIPASQKLDLPVVEFSRLQALFPNTICGVGLKSWEYDPTLSDSSCNSASEITSSRLEAVSKFETVFNEKKETSSSIWIYTCEKCDSAALPRYELTVHHLNQDKS